MLIELPYRLAVGESPYIQAIRNNVITLITAVVEVDGREKQVDTCYFNKGRRQGESRLPLMYWGKYVAHDNNRDGMGRELFFSAERLCGREPRAKIDDPIRTVRLPFMIRR